MYRIIFTVDSAECWKKIPRAERSQGQGQSVLSLTPGLLIGPYLQCFTADRCYRVTMYIHLYQCEISQTLFNKLVQLYSVVEQIAGSKC